jgi:hypothetical protein
MKVLEEGKDVEWEREIECPHCRSKLLITVADVEFRYGSFYRNGKHIIFHYGSYVVKCHEHYICIYSEMREINVDIFVDIPKHVKDFVMEHYKKEIERQ